MREKTWFSLVIQKKFKFLNMRRSLIKMRYAYQSNIKETIINTNFLLVDL